MDSTLDERKLAIHAARALAHFPTPTLVDMELGCTNGLWWARRPSLESTQEIHQQWYCRLESCLMCGSTPQQTTRQHYTHSFISSIAVICDSQAWLFFSSGLPPSRVARRHNHNVHMFVGTASSNPRLNQFWSLQVKCSRLIFHVAVSLDKFSWWL